VITVLGIAILDTILVDRVEPARAPAVAGARVDGLQPSLLLAGLIVLVGAPLLGAMPVDRR
jgi:hypothetical protein